MNVYDVADVFYGIGGLCDYLMFAKPFAYSNTPNA